MVDGLLFIVSWWMVLAAIVILFDVGIEYSTGRRLAEASRRHCPRS